MSKRAFERRYGHKKRLRIKKYEVLAGETRFEHATDGFGDRCSTVEPLP